MTSINIEDIPYFLKKSSYYEDSDKDGKQIVIDSEFLKKDLIIGTIDDFLNFIDIIIFWDIYFIPDVFFDFISKNAENIKSSSIYLKNKLCSYLSKHGYLFYLKNAHENGCPWDETTCSNAAKNGHYDCLKYAIENGCPWDETTCSNAAKNGHYDCLKYAIENGCPYNKDIIEYSCENGHYDCVKYLSNILFISFDNFSSAFSICEKNNNYRCMKYLYKKMYVKGINIV
jgi:hypothetical protein